MDGEKIFISYTDNRQRNDEELEKDKKLIKEFLTDQDKRKEQKNIDAVKNHIEHLNNRIQLILDRNMELSSENIAFKQQIKIVNEYCNYQISSLSGVFTPILGIISVVLFVFSFFSSGEARFSSVLLSILFGYAFVNNNASKRTMVHVLKKMNERNYS